MFHRRRLAIGLGFVLACFAASSASARVCKINSVSVTAIKPVKVVEFIGILEEAEQYKERGFDANYKKLRQGALSCCASFSMSFLDEVKVRDSNYKNSHMYLVQVLNGRHHNQEALVWPSDLKCVKKKKSKYKDIPNLACSKSVALSCF